MSESVKVIPKVWRSELPLLLLFFALSPIAVFLSNRFPMSVVHGELFRIFGTQVNLNLPLFGLIPLAMVMLAAYRIYNVRYALDSRFIECRQGILSFTQSITRVRYEDVRSLESDQSLIGRLLDVGAVQIGTAASGQIEIVLQGIAAPTEVQERIQRERDARQRLMKKDFGVSSSAVGV